MAYLSTVLAHSVKLRDSVYIHEECGEMIVPVSGSKVLLSCHQGKGDLLDRTAAQRQLLETISQAPDECQGGLFSFRPMLGSETDGAQILSGRCRLLLSPVENSEGSEA